MFWQSKSQSEGGTSRVHPKSIKNEKIPIKNEKNTIKRRSDDGQTTTRRQPDDDQTTIRRQPDDDQTIILLAWLAWSNKEEKT